MKVTIGPREFNMGSRELGELRDCNDLLDDMAALHARFDEDGYLFVRNLHPRETVLEARRTVIDYMLSQGAELEPGTDPMDAIFKMNGKRIQTLGRRDVTHLPAVRHVLEGKSIFKLFERYFDEPARTFDYKWLRFVDPGQSTPSHYDVVYMGRGSSRLMTCWTPMGDIPIEQGTLCVCPKSHTMPAFEKVRKTYGQSDVDRDLIEGQFTKDPQEIIDKFGGQWLTANMHAGDVIIIGMHTMHCSTNNMTKQSRLSCDTRFQPAADPIDERWVGENPKAHYAFGTQPLELMDKARARWGV